MRIFAFILLFLNIFSGFAQTASQLDQKNGFKSYKLGTSKSFYLKTLKLDCIDPASEKSLDKLKYRKGCKVLNNSEKAMFSAPIKEVWLRFNDDDKLDQIYISLKDNITSNFEQLYNDLKSSFGKHTSIKHVNSLTKGGFIKIGDSTLTASEIHLVWKGSRIQLELDAYYKQQTYTWGIDITIYDYKNRLEKGF